MVVPSGASPPHQGIAESIDFQAVTSQIDRILHSQTFARKSQLRRLLEILFRNLDSQTSLTPDQVIQELWPAEIRTKRSADVATEMNRLRHALKTYYDGEGASDPITISLPNRAATGGNGAHERPWIMAKPRPDLEDGAEEPLSDTELNTDGRLKKIIAIAALGTVLAIAAYFSIRVLAFPDQPRLGRLDGSALVIMNAEGKELWRKGFPAGFGPDSWYAEWRPPRIWFADLEGKGHTSVLFSYSPAGPLSHSSTLICYSDRGKEKWRWIPGRELPELAGSPATYLTNSLRVLKATDKRPPRIVVASQYAPWWPTQIALLDAKGKTLSEYWHSGGCVTLALADLDGDGREEIIATGVSEYDHQATLLVLDPDRLFGASTEIDPAHQIHGMGVGQERLRLLFPRSDLNRALFQYNVANEAAFVNGVLRFTVFECITPYPGGCPIYYEFDKNLHLISAYAGNDEFRSAHNRFYQSGNNPHTLSAEEQAAFLKVRCLVGCQSDYVPVGKLVP